VQAGILTEIRALAARRGMAVLFITHDLAVVHQLCDRVLVMHRGRIVERGPVAEVLEKPRHAYTQRLLAAIPRPERRGRRLGAPSLVPPPPPGTEPLLSFEDITVRFRRPDRTPIDAVRGVSLTLHEGEILGLVGESGSGKSTLARTAVGLATPETGRVRLSGQVLDWSRPQMGWRRQVQYIFQDPRGALDPAARLLWQIRLPLDIHRIGPRPERGRRARALLDETGLDSTLDRRKPAALSGGQRQRATIARALALSPQVLICDESVSALDVSIQARVLDLLMALRATRGIAILFISHDLSVIHHLCDRVAVMQGGALVEEGATEPLFAAPRHAYTQRLLAAIPRLPPARAEVPA
jgi:peptide/nickel transport system ATP-binding protein